MRSRRSSEADRHDDREDRDAVDAGDFDDLVAGYVDRLLAGERLDPLEVLLAHPGTGHEVLERLETFVTAGEDSPPLHRRLGDFTLIRELGRGGVGVVYEARQESMDRRVALKVLPAGVAADRAAFVRFLREAHTAGRLHHPAIVPVHSMGVESDTPYYAMELIEGATLAEVVAKRRQERRPNAAGVFATDVIDLAYFAGVAKAFAEVAAGLHHAHREGVVHRDIKPSNVIVDATGRLRILDFGLAYLEDLGTLTLTGEVVGTPLYMSPEQARREAITIDHRSDIYSLGATLYEVLTLAPPFRGKDRHETLRQIIERDPPPLRRREPRIPADLETIVLKCLRKTPDGRYGTAQALAQDLERFALGDAVEARPEAAWERVRRRLWRHGVRLGVGIAFTAREAVGLAPGDRTTRLLLASALLERTTRRKVVRCEEFVELLEELERLTKSEPTDQHAAFLLRMALETARPHLRLEARSSFMKTTTVCSAILVTLAVALGATRTEARDEVILDDFVADPEFADGEPLTWGSEDPCCPAHVEKVPGEGLRLEDQDRNENGGVLMTSEVFSGDVTIRTRSTVDSAVHAFLHLNLFAQTGYSVFVCDRCFDGDQHRVGLVRWDGSNVAPLWLEEAAGFDPSQGDVHLELSSQGAFVECRIWPEGTERPGAPRFRIRDERYRLGTVAFSVDPTPDFTPAPAFLRWAEVTVSRPDPVLFRRGDSNTDGRVDISDGIRVLGSLFLGLGEPDCADAADADDNGTLEITDAIALFDFLFLGGNPPPAPGPSDCGEDTGGDELGCASAECV
jgi:hypothetical protein